MPTKTTKLIFLKYLGIVLFLNTFVNVSLAKVDPPNYNFSLDTLKDFAPGGDLETIEKKYGKGIVVNRIEEIVSVKFFVAHIRYKFPVFVQLYKNKVLDFYATLPSYFLHDIFHQSIINRFGKQDKYIITNGHALYVWNNVDGIKYFYTGTCTITCFPIYFSGVLIKKPDELYSYKPIIMSLSDITF